VLGVPARRQLRLQGEEEVIETITCDDCGGKPDGYCFACDGRGSFAVLAEEPEPVAPPPPAPRRTPQEIADSTSVTGSKVRNIEPGQVDDDAVELVPCMVCGQPCAVPKAIINVIRRHNRREVKRADAVAADPRSTAPYVPELISNRQIAVCSDYVNGEQSPCVKAMRAKISRESHAALREIDHHFGELRAGRLTYDGATFLRASGYSDDVRAYYERQQALPAAGQSSASTAEKPKRQRKKKIAGATVLRLVLPEKTEG
jgi:hypothetical protein